ncbi:type 1 glutamine amidotransferase domain-containing protein [Streptomyces sp. 8L]|uniref:type 1 glutamine amidotransferase domain-containing protein n=1 Tax=Streptomyces sp. 8L TaxID=2877242 RepID=UPI001CD224A8|nr:type 1 glutamine amidotransferase domain-containing protein [Streptomyces sp. 8L]MCA1219306.1 type 1 glutamine amidotransferase [Streptomyces sp. 8L]
MRVAFLMAPEGVERVELTEPWQAVGDAGGERHLISTEPGRIQAFDHLDKADTFPVDLTAAEASVGDYDGLVLPGGVANPDALRMDKSALALVDGFFEAGKPVAAICHAPWTLVETDRVRGRTLTSWPSLRTDITNAGGTWVDEQVKVCTAAPSPLVTSRNPGDLKAFCEAFITQFGG